MKDFETNVVLRMFPGDGREGAPSGCESADAVDGEVWFSAHVGLARARPTVTEFSRPGSMTRVSRSDTCPTQPRPVRLKSPSPEDENERKPTIPL